MGDYIIHNGELYHWGVKGMRWGVRRYQNKDGTLTPLGKKKYAESIGNKKTSALTAEFNARKTIENVKEFTEYRQTGKAYREAVNKVDDYRKYKEAYHEKHDRIWRDVLRNVENKYGKYEDLERRNDTETMRKFDKEYNKNLDSNFKKHGIYDEEKILERKRESADEARTEARTEARKFVGDFLGRYGDRRVQSLMPSYSHKGYRIVRNIINQPTINDAITAAIMADLDGKHYTFK